MGTLLAMDSLRSFDGRRLSHQGLSHSWASKLGYKCGSPVHRAEGHDWSDALTLDNEDEWNMNAEENTPTPHVAAPSTSELCSTVITSKSSYSPQSVSWYQLSLEFFDALNAMLYNMPIHASNANAKLRCQSDVHLRSTQDSCRCTGISALILVVVSHNIVRLSRLLAPAAAFLPSPHLHLLLPSEPVLSHQPLTCP